MGMKMPSSKVVYDAPRTQELAPVFCVLLCTSGWLLVSR